MPDFRQLCPSCKRTLELPKSSIGSLAQCPVCECNFTAGATPSGTTATPDDTADGGMREGQQVNEQTPSQVTAPPSENPVDAEIIPDSDVTTPAAKSPIIDGASLTKPEIRTESQNANTSDIAATLPDAAVNVPPTNPMSPPATEAQMLDSSQTRDSSPMLEFPEGTNPFSQPLMQSNVNPETFNPYIHANEDLQSNAASRTEVQIVSCSTREIFRTAWAIMLDRGFSLLASLLVMIFIIGAATIAGIVLLNIASIFVTDLMITRIQYTAVAVISVLATISLCRNALGVARHTTRLLAESSIPFRSLHALVPATIAAATAVYFKSLLLPAYSVDLTVATITGLCTIGTLGWFWSSIFLCCDLQFSGFRSIPMAARIFYHNKLATLALISVNTCLLLIGVASFGFLLILAIPCIQILSAVAYLQMTSQPILDPRDLAADL